MGHSWDSEEGKTGKIPLKQKIQHALNMLDLDVKNGAPGRIRTCYPRIRSPILYPDELQARVTAASIPYLGLGRKFFLCTLTPLLPDLGLEEINAIFAGLHFRPGYDINSCFVPGLKIGQFFSLFVEEIIGHLERQPAFNPVDFFT